MAFTDSKNAVLYIGSFDLTSYTTEIGVNMSPMVSEVTCFGDSGAKFVRGHSDDKLSWSGIYDAATSGAEEAMNTLRGATTANIITAWPEGATLGTTGYGAGSGWLVGPEVTSSVGNAVAMSGELSLGSYDRIVSLGPRATSTVSAAGTGSIDNGASSTDGYAVYFHVFDASANGANAQWKVYVQSSVNSNFSSGTDHNSATVTTGTSFRASGTGTLHRYVRAYATLDADTGAITYQASFKRY